MKKGKIAFVHIFNSYTGSPMMLAQFINCMNFTERQLDPYVLTNHSPGAISNLPVNYSHIRYNFKPGRKIITLLQWLWAQVQIFFKLLWLNPTVVVINTIHPFSAMIYAYLFRKAHALYIHEHDFGNKHISNFLFYLVGRSNHQIVVSQALKNHRPEIKNAEIIPNSHSITQVDRKGRTLQAMGLVTMGDFDKKGVYAFIDLAKKMPTHKFILQTGLSESPLNGLLQNIDLPENIFARTATSNMQAFYEEIDLLLNLSNPKYCVETFGLTIVEAQASGIPAIGPTVGGPAEIINDQVDGFLVDPVDVGGIYRKIKSLVDDNEQYQSFCQAAYQNSLNFSQASYCAKVNTFMNSI